MNASIRVLEAMILASVAEAYYELPWFDRVGMRRALEEAVRAYGEGAPRIVACVAGFVS